jgi:hypothetical protein
MSLADADEIEDDADIFIAIFYWFQPFIFNGKLSVEQI